MTALIVCLTVLCVAGLAWDAFRRYLASRQTVRDDSTPHRLSTAERAVADLQQHLSALGIRRMP